MSEAWGADAIPQTRGNLVEALATAQHLPAEAMDAAIRTPGRIADAVLAAVERGAAGAALTDRDRNLVFWGIHVLAQVRDVRLFAPLLRLVRLTGDTLFDILAETLDGTLSRILISTYDGDPSLLEAAILDPAIEELVRFDLFGAHAFLTFEGRIDREAARRLLVRFDDARAARAGDLAWAGWESAVALGGFSDLADRVRAARADARLLVDDESDGFGATLDEATRHPADSARFLASGLGPIVDAVAELDEILAEGDEGEAPAPVVNPLRQVGRNDPCPCGSGLKHKKCCLGRAPLPA